ncbi:MAG: putative thiol-disulfide oxidoreductase [Ilumatobacteraceae bacterium]|nr:putative thiol-disulfide oxidoreductase [Ilumatobacteraceae bacterium]
MPPDGGRDTRTAERDPPLAWPLVKVRKRLLFGSLTVAAIASLAIGYAISDTSTASPGDAVNIDKDHQLDQPSLNTNAAVQGTPLPHVDVRTEAGDAFSTADLLQGQPLVVNYWTSTCVPCMKELPDFVAAHDQYGDKVRFVGIDAVAPTESEVQFAKDRGVDYELLYDGDGRFATAAGLHTQPVTLFVARDGTIVVQTGQIDLATIQRNVQSLLS